MNKLQAATKEYKQHETYVQDLNEQIRGYMSKFEMLRVDIQTGSQISAKAQEEMETKKMEFELYKA